MTGEYLIVTLVQYLSYEQTYIYSLPANIRDIYIIILLLYRTMYRSYISSFCMHCDQLRRYFVSCRSAKRRK